MSKIPKVHPDDETPELTPAKFTLYELPNDPFYQGVVCHQFNERRFSLRLGEYRVVLVHSGKGYKVRFQAGESNGRPRRLQRNLGVVLTASGIEGAVCFLRALRRGELPQIINNYQ